MLTAEVCSIGCQGLPNLQVGAELKSLGGVAKQRFLLGSRIELVAWISWTDKLSAMHRFIVHEAVECMEILTRVAQ